jgi:hypothetical protein
MHRINSHLSVRNLASKNIVELIIWYFSEFPKYFHMAFKLLSTDFPLYHPAEAFKKDTIVPF